MGEIIIKPLQAHIREEIFRNVEEFVTFENLAIALELSQEEYTYLFNKYKHDMFYKLLETKYEYKYINEWYIPSGFEDWCDFIYHNFAEVDTRYFPENYLPLSNRNSRLYDLISPDRRYAIMRRHIEFGFYQHLYFLLKYYRHTFFCKGIRFIAIYSWFRINIELDHEIMRLVMFVFYAFFLGMSLRGCWKLKRLEYLFEMSSNFLEYEI